MYPNDKPRIKISWALQKMPFSGVRWFSGELPQMPVDLRNLDFPAQLTSTINKEGKNDVKIQI